MIDNWEYWLTSGISFFALVNSILARKEAKKAHDAAKDSERRNELNQHYPVLNFQSLLSGSSIVFNVKNTSPNRDTTLLDIRYHLQIKAERHEVSDEITIDISSPLEASSEKDLSCEKLDAYLKELTPIILTKDPEQTSIFIRAWLESKPALYECESVREQLEATFSHNGKELIPVRHTR